MAEREEELKSLLMKVKEDRKKKAGLKLNIQKTKIIQFHHFMASMETVAHFIFLDFMNLKQRYHFADKGPSSQSYGFSSGHVWT